MTNTKFRKRALLSSVAMLLVALVALGSATFAWFVDDPTAKASGISGTAQTATGLLIKTSTDSTWSHNAILANGITDPIIFAPATTSNGSTYFSAKAARSNNSAQQNAVAGVGEVGDDDYVAAVESKWSSVGVLNHVAGTGVYYEQINLKRTVNLTGSATEACYLDGLEMNLNTSNRMYTGVTVVLFWNNTPHFYHYGSTGTISKWSDLAANADVTDADDTWTVTQKADEFGTAGATTGKEVVGTFSSGTTQIDIDMYVFLDGANSAVYTDNSDASDLINSIVPKFALASNYGA